MAAISAYKIAAAEIVLDRRYRDSHKMTEEQFNSSMLYEMLARFEHEDQQGRAAAEYWLNWMVGVKEEFGPHAVRDVLQRHRLVGVL